MKNVTKLLTVILSLLLVIVAGCKKKDISNDSGGSFTNSSPLCFTAVDDWAKIEIIWLNEVSASYANLDFEYSYDKMHWHELKIDETRIVLENKGDKVYFRGDNPSGLNTKKDINIQLWDIGVRFYTVNKVAASGNIMSLIDPSCKRKSVPDYCFMKLFEYTSITTAPELPATELGEQCYEEMFYYCQDLEVAPELPATALAKGCYGGMFLYCQSLTEAPKLPATTMVYACYASMFMDCSSLTTPPELPATTLAPSCYAYMFTGCTGLTEAPELPATTLAPRCYYTMFARCSNLASAPVLQATDLAEECYDGMFTDCTSLVTAPELPATNLVKSCYGRMFAGCSNLTTAPELPATTLAENCYYQMFISCERLNTIRVNFTEWSNATSYWVEGVPYGGTFYCPSALPQEFGYKRIPTGWYVVTF